MKKLLICLTILFSIFLFNNKINAEELSNFCEYTNPCLTTERIEEILSSNSVIATDYVVTLADYKTDKMFAIMPVVKEDIDAGLIYINDTGNYKQLFYNSGRSSVIYVLNNRQTVDVFDTTITSFNKTRIASDTSYTFSFSYLNTGPTIYAYYSTLDIPDSNGEIYFYAKSEEIKDTRNIITILSDTLNGFITNLNENGITFSEILIGLFIFNFVVYVITYMIKHFE